MRFALEYIRWHYYEGLISIYYIIGNFVWFFYEFFSIPILLKTLFNPFNRLDEGYAKGFRIELWLQTFVVNSLMRVVGALLRLMLILFGIAMILITVLIGACFLLAWTLAPLFLTFLVLYGIKLISIA